MLTLTMSVVASAFLLAGAETLALRAFTRPEMRERVFDSIRPEVACAPIMKSPAATSTMCGSASSFDTALTVERHQPRDRDLGVFADDGSVLPAVFSASKPTSPVNTAMPTKFTSASPGAVASAVDVELRGGDPAGWLRRSRSGRRSSRRSSRRPRRRPNPANPPESASGVVLAVAWMEITFAVTVARPRIAARAWPPTSATETAPLAAANALTLKPSCVGSRRPACTWPAGAAHRPQSTTVVSPSMIACTSLTTLLEANESPAPARPSRPTSHRRRHRPSESSCATISTAAAESTIAPSSMNALVAFVEIVDGRRADATHQAGNREAESVCFHIEARSRSDVDVARRRGHFGSADAGVDLGRQGRCVRENRPPRHRGSRRGRRRWHSGSYCRLAWITTSGASIVPPVLTEASVVVLSLLLLKVAKPPRIAAGGPNASAAHRAHWTRWP